MTAPEPTRVLVAGGGGVGRALALLLRHEPSLPVAVTVGDLSAAVAAEAAEFASAGAADPAVRPLAMPAEGADAALEDALEGADVLVDCLPGREAPRMARLARERGLHYLNLTEYVRETEEVLAIAEGAPTCFALQCGLAPGYIDVLGCHLIERATREWGVDRFDRLRLRVGALPRFVTAPHFYGWTWSPVGVATEYVEDAVAVREGRVVRLPALAEREGLVLDGTAYEEALTSGGAADLPQALLGRVDELDYKTLRHPGHYAWVSDQLAGCEPGEDRAALLQRRMETAIPRVEDDRVVVFAELVGRDAQGRFRALRRALDVPGLELGGRWLRAIQSTTAAGVAEVLRIVLEHDLRGPLLQSRVPADDFLSGPFVRRAYAHGERPA